MQVILPEEQTKEIQLFVVNLIKNEIETVKEDSGQISPFLIPICKIKLDRKSHLC